MYMDTYCERCDYQKKREIVHGRQKSGKCSSRLVSLQEIAIWILSVSLNVIRNCYDVGFVAVDDEIFGAIFRNQGPLVQ